MDPRVADLIDRIPALRALRGYAQIEAEEAISNAFADVIEDYLADGEMDASTGGAP
jgi:hypothetical protein